MQRTYRKPVVRAGLGALTALLVLLAGMGSSVASATSEPVRLATMAAAAPLERGAGYGSPAEAERVRAVQRVLRRHGWAPGPVDGLFGPRTEAAVLRFQAAAGLAVDGVVGEQTARALAQARSGLRRGAGYQSAAGSQRVRTLQSRLQRLGLNPGPVDGRFGPRTEAAVARLQQAAKLDASGAVDARTRRVLASAPQRGDREARPVAAGLKDVGPRVLGSVTPSPLATPSATTNDEGVELWLALAIAAAALLAGLLCGGLWVRSRTSTAADPADQPRHEQPPPQQSPVPQAPEQPAVSEPDRRPALRAVNYAPVGGANGQDGEALEPPNDQPQGSQPTPRQPQPPPGQLRASATALAAPRLYPQPEPELAAPPPALGELDPQPRSLRAVGYVSVPKANDDSRALETQAEAIARLCKRRGWQLLHVVRDVENGHPKGMERPGLMYALERIAQGEASCLVVSELERLSRSAADLGRIVEWLDQYHSRLVAIDLRLDTGSAQGRLTASTLIAVGEWEGRRIAEQTKKGLAAARARRATTGRPAVEDIPALKDRIVAMRQDGMTLQAIADQLNNEATPTLRGGTQWRPSSVQAAAGYRRPKNRKTILDQPPKPNQP
jgi:peptidoglycan hydrolase-like protein with peptidoglycan-binding domain/DNA invertase Pin-like site-specific DNA recombinase